MENMICVNVLGYIDDCHTNIPEEKRQWIAEMILRNFDYTDLYALVDEHIEQICRMNKLPYGQD